MENDLKAIEELIQWANCYVRPRGVDGKAACIAAEHALARLKAMPAIAKATKEQP
jgi:hypothetical protein